MSMDMQHQAMGYDRTATMFSPDGHLLQVEYAEKTVRLGVSSIGMVTKEGVFIIADRRIDDKLVVQDSANRVHEIDSHVIASVAGITSDARVLIEKAQVLAQQNRVTYDSPVEPELVIKEISNIKQQFTQYGGARPFGVSMMLGGVYNNKPQLFASDITGNYFGYHAHAIGENDEKIKEKLREKYKKDMTLKQGIKLTLDIFKEIKGNNFDINKYEMINVPLNEKLKKYEGDEINNLIK
ncbi:MAG TPA: archaeal proteasome endopeptidase complex subunit alpha [Candidatus Nanoarchaeia archaeon]|nr:archaeal proteasome endopeptidase complex subunit alpha [Candidatus Nanoarchaeia archaeon]